MSVAVIVIEMEVPVSVVSEEFMVMELAKVSQTGSGFTDQTILIAVPEGFGTIVGRLRIEGAPK